MMYWKLVVADTGFIQQSWSKIQGLYKDFLRQSYSFQGIKVYENILIQVLKFYLRNARLR